MKSSFI